jgi:hypothetical protein
MLELYAENYRFSMRDTNCGDKCIFVKNGWCKTDAECCNYQESIWQESRTNEQLLVKDCIPKRLMLMQQNDSNRSIAIQSSAENLSHRIETLEKELKYILLATKKFILEQQTQKAIEGKICQAQHQEP